MLFTVYGDRSTLGKAGADAIGPFVAFIPLRADRQARLAELALQRRIGDRAENGALIVRQDHRETGACDLFVQALHLSPGNVQQPAHALLQFPDELRIVNRGLPRRLRLHVVFTQATLPRPPHMRFYSGRYHAILNNPNNTRRMTRCEMSIGQVSPPS